MAQNTLSSAKIAKQTKKGKPRFTRDDLELTLLALPTTIWYLLFCYLPMFGILIAFKRYRPLPGQNFLVALMNSEWVGLNNFEFLFKTRDSWIMVRNTVGYNLIFIALGMVVAVTLAIMINKLYSKRLQKVFQTAMFMPHFLSWVVVSYFVFSFLSYDRGIVNSIIASMGGERIQWYMEGKYWPYLLVFFNLWKGTGYSMVVYLASIAGIDGTYYEAAIIDGASQWQQVRYVTLPLLRPVMTILVILNLGRIFNSDFGLFYQATRDSGEIIDYRQTIDTYVYSALMRLNNIGFASAASAFQSLVGCATILLANLVVRKLDADSALF